MLPCARTKWRTLNEMQEVFLSLFSLFLLFGELRLLLHLPLNEVHIRHLQGEIKTC